MNSRQQTPLAPFFARLLAGEAATHRETLGLQRDQRGVDLRLVQPEGVSNLRGRDGTQAYKPAAHGLDQRVVQRCKWLAPFGSHPDLAILPFGMLNPPLPQEI